MNEQLESDIREAFASRSASIPGEAVARIRGIDYHPRTRRLSTRVKIGGLAGATAAGATVVSLVVFAGAAPAFAGWTATPGAASTSGVGGDPSSTCVKQINEMPNGEPASDFTPVVTDVRGPYTLIVFTGTGPAAGSVAQCLTGPSVTSVSERSAGGQTFSSGVASASGGAGTVQGGSSGTQVFDGTNGLDQISLSHLDASSQGPFTTSAGQVSSDVTAVTITLSDGTDVQSTLGSSWFVAWWPGSATATSIQLTTPSGVRTQPLG